MQVHGRLVTLAVSLSVALAGPARAASLPVIHLVDEIAPGDYSSYAMDGNDTAVLGNWIYTYADAPATGGEVYRSNGKRTELVADIDEGTDYSSPDNFYTYRGWVYFSAAEDTNGNELWRTDGSTTKRVCNIAAGSASSYPANFAGFGDWLYFSADDRAVGNELWRTDGENCERVDDIRVGASGSNPFQ
ncbi:MAG: hypothetical protein ACKN9R_06285, partial [Candidatus Limnocylindrus sp.]